MADNTLPPGGLSGAQSTSPSARRAFLRRAVGAGVPVVLATVRGRSVLAQDNTTATGSGCLSMHPSGWLGANQFGGNEQDPNLLERQQNCAPYLPQDENLGGSESVSEPIFADPFSENVDGETGPGKGHGKGGSKK